MAARTTIAEPAEKWTGALAASRDRLLAGALGGGHGVAVLAHASAGRIAAGWTLDQAMRLLTQRAAGLSDDDLDWQPPDGGWPLRRILHHVARSEVLYAASFDEVLPDDPVARYAEADARFSRRLVAARAMTDDPSI